MGGGDAGGRVAKIDYTRRREEKTNSVLKKLAGRSYVCLKQQTLTCVWLGCKLRLWIALESRLDKRSVFLEPLA